MDVDPGRHGPPHAGRDLPGRAGRRHPRSPHPAAACHAAAAARRRGRSAGSGRVPGLECAVVPLCRGSGAADGRVPAGWRAHPGDAARAWPYGDERVALCRSRDGNGGRSGSACHRLPRECGTAAGRHLDLHSSGRGQRRGARGQRRGSLYEDASRDRRRRRRVGDRRDDGRPGPGTGGRQPGRGSRGGPAGRRRARGCHAGRLRDRGSTRTAHRSCSRRRAHPGGGARRCAAVPAVSQGPDALQKGQRAITTFNRNWQNRMGVGGEGFLAGPSVVAASALLGYMAPPGELGLSWNPDRFGV